ncbi:hypothetical protein CTEN210_02655 [Chaetoceros tenuissimus]|uniref:Methionyl/Leucyl tRNA synthetase domain-containing protein n=1 Tax=Chaetoceros tenuissimus TaxID=426638 RepID=A0AAD3CHY4_9STRA|nr:hypothetical protein CTEN210_02655 [Chaetoceros tenuissimus]
MQEPLLKMYEEYPEMIAPKSRLNEVNLLFRADYVICLFQEPVSNGEFLFQMMKIMSSDLPLPKRVYAHGWWTKDGEKISKSLGYVVDPVEFVDKYGVDPTRFVLMSEVPFGNDGDFSDLNFVYRCNANLANELGNIAHRVCTLVYKNCDQSIPTPGEFLPEDVEILENAKAVRDIAAGHIANQAISQFATTMIIVSIKQSVNMLLK